MKSLRAVGCCFLVAAFLWGFLLAQIHVGSHNYKGGYEDGYQQGAMQGFDYAIKQCDKPGVLQPRLSDEDTAARY